MKSHRPTGVKKKWRAMDLLEQKKMESHRPTRAKKKWRAIDLLKQKRNGEP